MVSLPLDMEINLRHVIIRYPQTTLVTQIPAPCIAYRRTLGVFIAYEKIKSDLQQIYIYSDL